MWQLAKKFALCFRCLKRSHRIGRCLLKGTCPIEGCDHRHHAQLHATIQPPKLNPSAETFLPSQADVEGTTTAGTLTTYATYAVIHESASVRRPGRVALQIAPVILQGKSGVRIKANAFLDEGSGSSYFKEEIADALGLEAESRPLRVPVFGAKSTVTDSKTVTVQLESLDGGAKREIPLWTTLNICEMKAVDWFHTTRGLSHLCDLEIPKPAWHGGSWFAHWKWLLWGTAFTTRASWRATRRTCGCKDTIRMNNCWAFSRTDWASVTQPSMHTRSMRTPFQKCEVMTWCGRYGMKMWWVSHTGTSLWHQKKCLPHEYWWTVWSGDFLDRWWTNAVLQQKECWRQTLLSWKTSSTRIGCCWEILSGIGGQWNQGLHTEAGARRSRWWTKLVPTPFSCGERR